MAGVRWSKSTKVILTIVPSMLIAVVLLLPLTLLSLAKKQVKDKLSDARSITFVEPSTSTDQNGNTVYTNTNFNYSITVPKDWLIKEKNSQVHQTVLLYYSKNFKEGISIAFGENYRGYRNLDEYLEFLQDPKRSGISLAEKNSAQFKEILIDGQRAVQRTILNPVNGLVDVSTYMILNDKILSIGFGYVGTPAIETLNAYNEVISSFKFL